MKFVLTVCILLVGMAGLYAQDQEHRISLNAGFSLPVGDFADTADQPNAGFAQFGFTAGVGYDLLPGWANLAWSSGFYYITNAYQSESLTRGIDLDVIESGSYSNYAVLTGAKWNKSISDNFEMFLVGQAGFVYAKGPYFNGVPAGDTQADYVEFEMGTSSGAALSAGIGFLANKRTVFSVHYFHLGTHTFSQRVNYTQDSQNLQATVQWNQPITLITLNVGYSIQFD